MEKSGSILQCWISSAKIPQKNYRIFIFCVFFLLHFVIYISETNKQLPKKLNKSPYFVPRTDCFKLETHHWDLSNGKRYRIG